MKYQVEVQTSCGSITYEIKADSKTAAKYKIIAKMTDSGWIETDVYPGHSQFRISKVKQITNNLIYN